MKINQIVQETTTSGSVATVEHGFVKMQTRNPGVYGNTKAGSLFKGKKTKAPFANSVNESAELSEADLQEDDIIVLPGQGRKLKTGFVPHGKSRVDHEVEMARSDVLATMKNARSIYELLKNKSEEEGLEGWVQEKLVKANDYLNSVKEYYDEKMMQQESVPPAGVIGNGAMGESSQRVDSLVTDALKIMRGSEASDAVKALKIVLGDREYNSRRNFYNFYIKQMIDMYGQQGVAEGVADMHSDELLNTVRDAIRKAIKETGDQSLSKIFVCLRSAIPASEALKNITSPISLEAVDNALQEVGIDFDDLLNFINKQAEKYGKQGVAEGHTEVKDKQGKVVSWRNDTEWHKAEKNKQGQPKDPRGIVTHLSDVARRKTEKQDTKEGKIDFAKKLGNNIDKSNKAVVKTKKEVGSRVADIGAGGKEYNVKTDKAWDDAQKAKKAK